jgi:hypothetical protein
VFAVSAGWREMSRRRDVLPAGVLGGCAVGFTEISEIGKFGKFVANRVRGRPETRGAPHETTPPA